MHEFNIVNWLESQQAVFTEMSDRIWQQPELAFEEQLAVQIQTEYLEKIGFKIERQVGGLATAFIASWGEGPAIGMIGEYDALPGLSQQLVTYKSAVQADAAGHGCGHNLLGVGCLAAAVAVKEYLQANALPGCIRYYGCPAEERIIGKTLMAKAAAFDDLAAALTFHPARLNEPSKEKLLGLYDLTFTFSGIAAHAGEAPHLGRSALDAVELMNVGANYLREHLPKNVQFHYCITEGGKQPNIVPDKAVVWYYLRALQETDLDDLLTRIRAVAAGAALMTGTAVQDQINGACRSYLPNSYLTDRMYSAMQKVGPIQYSPSEYQFAEQLNQSCAGQQIDNFFENPFFIDQPEAALPKAAIYGDIFPCSNQLDICNGSNDLGDVSWITPTANIYTACLTTGSSVHTWQATATCGMSIGHKGMLFAAKALALTAVDLLQNPEHLQLARQEFTQFTAGKPYCSPL
ncbi:MAG: hypothetical protein OFPII_30250 [Osedax symbiont Rs1]|nr:MAG: hypothetical protein OFPII_30250 [Osedax symbiont Rs1]